MKDGRLNVLIGCEFSGRVREAFRALGHNAYSCDVEPAADNSPYHLRCNVLYVLHPTPDNTYYRGPQWDLGIFHPPCTRLCNSGVRWLYKGGRGTVPDPTMWDAMIRAVDFFDMLWRSGIPKLAIENPIMHRHAAERLNLPEPQIIQPWQFGHGETKATCLWTRGLPLLRPTAIVDGRRGRVHHEPPGPDRWKRRSITYDGVAQAMAAQWGSPLTPGDGRREET